MYRERADGFANGPFRGAENTSYPGTASAVLVAVTSGVSS